MPLPRPDVTRRALLVSGAAVPLAFSGLARADDDEGIRTRGVLRIGTAGDYAPFSLAEGKGFVGLDIELGKRLAKDFGVRAEWVRFAWPDLAQGLKAGHFDLAMSGITARGERALGGALSRPYAVVSAVAVVRANDRSRFKDWTALDQDGVQLIVNAGGHLEKVARGLFPRASISTTTNNLELLPSVLGKKADAAISDSAELHAHTMTGLTSLGPMTHDRKALFIMQGAPKFADWVDGWLRERERDGFLPRLRRRFLSAPRADDAPMAAEAVLGPIQLRCEVMPFVAAFKAAHGLPVVDASQEARVIARSADTARAAGLDPDAVQGLYRALIGAAKEIELARASEPSPANPTLDEVRGVIRGIDAQLLSELREALHSSLTVDWWALLERCVSVDGLTPPRKAEIAEALANVRLA
jgi:cyclohexadienyl dehydratase